MSASDHVHPDQLRLFVQAKELMNYPTLEWQSTDTPTTLRLDRNLRYHKLKESKTGHEYNSQAEIGSKNNKEKPSLYQSIREKGVQTPVSLTFNRRLQQNTIDNGHHRIVAANDINPEMEIPVQYKS